LDIEHANLFCWSSIIMKSLLLLLTAASLFQFTEQFHISKRELTEYDLTNFIVNTCSAEKPEVLIQSLCDHTLQSALMGNFPFLTYYCKTNGSGRRYCSNFNKKKYKECNSKEILPSVYPQYS